MLSLKKCFKKFVKSWEILEIHSFLPSIRINLCLNLLIRQFCCSFCALLSQLLPFRIKQIRLRGGFSRKKGFFLAKKCYSCLQKTIFLCIFEYFLCGICLRRLKWIFDCWRISVEFWPEREGEKPVATWILHENFFGRIFQFCLNGFFWFFLYNRLD